MDFVLVVAIWVWLPSLPLRFWFDELFKVIGNQLGLFYEVHTSYKKSSYMVMMRILVRLNLLLSLLYSSQFKLGPQFISILCIIRVYPTNMGDATCMVT